MKKALYTRIYHIPKVLVLLCIILATSSSTFAQGTWKDTTINCKMLTPAFSAQLPAASLAKEFSWNFAIGGSFYFKMKHNILFGIDGNYFFGTDIKDSIFKYISNTSGGILGESGVYSNVALYERGYNITARIGKVFPMFHSNKNSGLVLLAGAGFLQHKIKILVINNDIPELTGDYLKGYDHLTNGPCLTQSIGYQHLGRHNLGNFNVSLEGFEAFTKNRRTYNFDTMGPDNSLHIDVLIGIKVGFILPFYTDVSKNGLYLLTMNVFFTLIYDSIIFFYATAIRVASIFNPKASKWINGRKHIFLHIKNVVDTSSENVWFHCASLGEFEQCRPVLEGYRENFPQYKIILTFFSPSGYEVQKNYDKADHIFYLPYDSRRNANRFIELINPKLAVFVKYEFWWHYLYTLHRKNIPAILVSGIFRKNQFFFTALGKPFSAILHLYNQLFVQDESSLQLLNSIGVTNAQIAPDTRFDRVLAIAQQQTSLPTLELFCKNADVFIAGSTWPEDEKILADFFYTTLAPCKIKLVIAPHEISANHIHHLLRQFNTTVLYSNSAAVNENSQVLIIDSVGLLSRIYKLGKWAYVGGGFGSGIHNMLEPAVYGLPVFFGPNWKKFNEAKNLLESGGAFCINNSDELTKSFDAVKNTDDTAYKNISNGNKRFVANNGGGTEKILSYLKTVTKE